MKTRRLSKRTQSLCGFCMGLGSIGTPSRREKRPSRETLSSVAKEDVHEFITAAGHGKAPANLPLLPGFIICFLEQLAASAGLRRLGRKNTPVFHTSVQRSRRQLPNDVIRSIVILPHEQNPLLIDERNHHTNAGMANCPTHHWCFRNEYQESPLDSRPIAVRSRASRNAPPDICSQR